MLPNVLEYTFFGDTRYFVRQGGKHYFFPPSWVMGAVLSLGSTYAALDVVWNELYSCLTDTGSISGWEAGNALASRAVGVLRRKNCKW